MKHFLTFFLSFLFIQYSANAQTKAIPPYEPEQFVRNIIQELDIPDDTFNKMRGKDNMIRSKLFLNEKGEVLKVTVEEDEWNLAELLLPIIKQFPNFTPAMIDGVPKSSMYNLSFALNEYTYYKIVRQTATPEVGKEKFIKKIYSNFYISDIEKKKLDIAKTKETYTLIIDFIVEKDGSLSSFKMRDKEMDYFKSRLESAIKKASKKWIPGKINGESVRTKTTFTLTLNIDFRSLNI